MAAIANICFQCGLRAASDTCPGDDAHTMVPDLVHLKRRFAGRYQVVRMMGHGGMACVYEAHDHEQDRRVAIKVLLRKLTATAEHARRFEKEARICKQLDHPNTINVYDFGKDDGLLYFSMELLEGISLSSHLRKQHALDAPEVIRIMLQICDSLAVAHERGVVHRDLKPSNIFLAQKIGINGWVKVLDFGIAKIVAATDAAGGVTRPIDDLTKTGFSFGTPKYMAPEQLQGKPVDARTDLYSLGLMFFEMLSGTHPFASRTNVEIAGKHLYETVPDVPQPAGRPPIARPLKELTKALLSKDAEQRPPSARAVAEQLARMTTLPDLAEQLIDAARRAWQADASPENLELTRLALANLDRLDGGRERFRQHFPLTPADPNRIRPLVALLQQNHDAEVLQHVLALFAWDCENRRQHTLAAEFAQGLVRTYRESKLLADSPPPSDSATEHTPERWRVRSVAPPASSAPALPARRKFRFALLAAVVAAVVAAVEFVLLMLGPVSSHESVPAGALPVSVSTPVFAEPAGRMEVSSKPVAVLADAIQVDVKVAPDVAARPDLRAGPPSGKDLVPVVPEPDRLAEANALIKAEQWDKAAALLRELSSKHPDHAEVRDLLSRVTTEKAVAEAYNRIRSLADKGQTDAARNELNRQILPNTSVYLERFRQLREQIRPTRQVGSAQPAPGPGDDLFDDPNALVKEARSARADGDYGRSVVLLKTALKLPGAPRRALWQELALAYEGLGDKSQAVAAYQTLLNSTSNPGEQQKLRTKIRSLGSNPTE